MGGLMRPAPEPGMDPGGSSASGTLPRRAMFEVIRAFVKTVEKVDLYTSKHNNKTAQLAIRLARRLGFAPAAIRLIHQGALLHDIGKIGIPASILLRPGKLSPIEYALVKEHAAIGWEVISEIGFAQPIALMIRQHHERLDGSGYPDGLANGSILPESMVVAIADVVHALLAQRPYRRALDDAAITGILEEDRGHRLPARFIDTAVDILHQEGDRLRA